MVDNISKRMNANNSVDYMKIEEQFSKLFPDASIGKKFMLKCWLEYCKVNKSMSFNNFCKTQNLHNFLDKLHYGIVDYADISSEEDVEKALYQEFGEY